MEGEVVVFEKPDTAMVVTAGFGLGECEREVWEESKEKEGECGEG